MVLFFKEMAARYDGNHVAAETFDVFDASAYKESFLRSEEGKKRLEEFKACLMDTPPSVLKKSQRMLQSIIVF